jgi:hypothetical protein
VVALDPGAHDPMSQDTSAVLVTALRSARRAGSRVLEEDLELGGGMQGREQLVAIHDSWISKGKGD